MSKELVHAVILGEESNQLFLDALKEKVQEALEVKKVQVAESVFDSGDCKSCEVSEEIKPYVSKLGRKWQVLDHQEKVRYETEDREAARAHLRKNYDSYRKPMKEESEQIAEAGYGFVAPAIPDVVTKRHLDDGLIDVRHWRNDRSQGPSNPNYVNAKNHYHKLIDKADKSVVRAHYKKILKDASVKEDVQQIDEVGDTPKGKATLASYVKKAAPQIRSNTTLRRDFEDEKYRHLKTALKHSPNVDPHKTHERDPEKRANAEYLSKGASDLSDRFALKAKNRIKGIQRAADRLAKEEVEQVNEKAPPGAKYERMVKHIKDKYSKDGLTNKEKAIAYATAWKAKKAEK